MRAVALLLVLTAALGRAQITPTNAARTIHPGEVTDPGRRVAVFVGPVLFDEEEFQHVHRSLVVAGWRPVIVGADTGIARGYENTVVRPELAGAELDPASFAALVLIGGSGAVLHWQDSALFAVARGFAEAGKPVAASGLAVPILARAGILAGRKTAFFRDAAALELVTDHGARFRFAPVIADGNIITAAGADIGTRRRFAAAVVAALKARR